MLETVIKEQVESNECKCITNVITDGPYKKALCEHMKETWSETNLNNVFLNATKALLKFISPSSPSEKMNKILCLGKVQSGKTSFFISTIALAFDNGYDIAYVIGGTKTNLLSQNKDRILEEFSNNDDILIMDINNANVREVKQRINCGCKVILMVLKHKSKTSESNLANLEQLTSSLSDVPSLIVDDEGDEYSPGAKSRPKAVSQAILNCVKFVKRGTYLSVTATPQSNLLLSTTLDNLSPDDCVLVEPGNGYTGANVFHDTMENTLVKEANDTENFELGVPKSFCEALKYFILGCGVRYLRGDTSAHSMLVHPSSNTTVQNIIYNKVRNELDSITSVISDDYSLGYDDLYNEFKKIYEEEMVTDSNYFPFFDELYVVIKKNLNKTRVYQINTKEGSKDSQDIGMDKFFKYKIYVGGNMLERGITLKNLAVTYIYRTAKENPVDNTLQRARWFGYKQNYLDLCKVYMPSEMKRYFVDINNHENYLWQTIRNFLKTGQPMQKMKRVFVLSNENLILTRKTVSKTVTLGKINAGYTYDRSLSYASDKEYKYNYQILEEYFNTLGNSQSYFYGRNNEHVHKYYENISLKDFYENVIKRWNFPYECTNINRYVFKSLIDSVEADLIPDYFTLIKMRDGENQYRSTMSNGMAIKELPESYQVTNDYVGDKGVFEHKLNIQVHYVYTNKEEKDNLVPFLTINYPYDSRTTKFVTGEFEYEN